MESIVEIKGYRATATIAGDICVVKAHLGNLLHPYDHYKVTKSGWLTGYWKTKDMTKYYRDALVPVPFRKFEVIQCNDVLLKLKIIS
jgi:hypothetical protein